MLPRTSIISFKDNLMKIKTRECRWWGRGISSSFRRIRTWVRRCTWWEVEELECKECLRRCKHRKWNQWANMLMILFHLQCMLLRTLWCTEEELITPCNHNPRRWDSRSHHPKGFINEAETSLQAKDMLIAQWRTIAWWKHIKRCIQLHSTCQDKCQPMWIRVITVTIRRRQMTISSIKCGSAMRMLCHRGTIRRIRSSSSHRWQRKRSLMLAVNSLRISSLILEEICKSMTPLNSIQHMKIKIKSRENLKNKEKEHKRKQTC